MGKPEGVDGIAVRDWRYWEDVDHKADVAAFHERREALQALDAAMLAVKRREVSPPYEALLCTQCLWYKHWPRGCRCDQYGTGQVGWPRNHLPWG